MTGAEPRSEKSARAERVGDVLVVRPLSHLGHGEVGVVGLDNEDALEVGPGLHRSGRPKSVQLRARMSGFGDDIEAGLSVMVDGVPEGPLPTVEVTTRVQGLGEATPESREHVPEPTPDLWSVSLRERESFVHYTTCLAWICVKSRVFVGSVLSMTLNLAPGNTRTSSSLANDRSEMSRPWMRSSVSTTRSLD